MNAIDRLRMLKESLQAKKEEKARIKNLRVGRVKKNKKYSLQKVAVIGMSIAIAGSLFLSSCGINDKKTPSVPSTPSYTAVQEDTRYSMSNSNIQGTNYASSLEETPITYDDTAYNTFDEYLDGYDLDFSTIDEIYDIDGATNYIGNDRKVVEDHMYSGFIVDGKVNESKLLQSVIDNSPTYKEENKDKCLFYSVITDQKKLKEIVHIVAESINEDLPYKTEEDIKELDCTLGSLRVFSNTGLNAAGITNDNVLLINEPMIKMLEINSGNEDGIVHTIYHESKHLEQVSCNDYDHEPYEYQGVSVKSDNMAKNPYSWTWLLEGSAEKTSTAQVGGNDEAYINLVGYVETVDLATIPSSLSLTGNDIEQTTLNKDRAKFYELLGANNGISQKEIVEAMYAMEIVQKKVATYQEDYKNNYGAELSDDEYLNIRYSLRRDFILEMSKIFYNNLAISINNRNDVTLEDIFYLITIFEGDMNYHLDYCKSGRITDDTDTQNFLRRYAEIQESFFSSITVCNSIEYSDIIEKYNQYGLFVKSDNQELSANASLRWMNDSKKAWLLEKAQGSRMLYGNSIQQIIAEIGQDYTK